MLIITILALLSSFVSSSDMLDNSSQYTQKLHKICVDFLISTSSEPENIQSVLCGSSITDTQLNFNLSKTSLLHLFIISGSHLVILDSLMTRAKIPFVVRHLFLLVYSLITKLEAPVLRALTSLWFQQLLKKLNLKFSSDLKVLCAGLFTLIININLWDSRSLQLSWLAALGLCMSLIPTKNIFYKVILSQIAIYVFLLPALYGFGNLHPLSVFFNLTIGILLGVFLIPTALIAALIPSAYFIFESLLDAIHWTSIELTHPIQISKHSLLSNQIIWLWIFSLHIFFIFIRKNFIQGKDQCRF